MNQRGFTLVEMMVAVMVSGATVVMAAKVAQVVTNQTIRNQSVTDGHNRAELIRQQIRADVQVAGYGSTGLIGLDPAAFPTLATVTSVGGVVAIPAVAGTNNNGAIGLGGAIVQTNSDLLQVVVPDPTTVERTIDAAVIGGNTIFLDPTVNFNCPPNRFVYIVDHTRSNGTGRTQIAPLGAGGSNIILNGGLVFSVSAGSEVMCARISTYYVDQSGWLHRNDLRPNVGYFPVGGLVNIDAGLVGIGDRIAPGVVDLQAAFRVSSAAYGPVYGGAAFPVNATNAQQWAFEGGGGILEGLMVGNTPRWGEVRQVRVDLLVRTLRRGDYRRHVQDLVTDRRMDAAAQPYGVAPTAGSLMYDWETATETLMSLRYFDKLADVTLAPEPI